MRRHNRVWWFTPDSDIGRLPLHERAASVSRLAIGPSCECFARNWSAPIPSSPSLLFLPSLARSVSPFSARSSFFPSFLVEPMRRTFFFSIRSHFTLVHPSPFNIQFSPIFSKNARGVYPSPRRFQFTVSLESRIDKNVRVIFRVVFESLEQL